MMAEKEKGMKEALLHVNQYVDQLKKYEKDFPNHESIPAIVSKGLIKDLDTVVYMANQYLY